MVLLRHQDEPVSEPQHGEWRTRLKAKVLAKLFWNRNLALLADSGYG